MYTFSSFVHRLRFLRLVTATTITVLRCRGHVVGCIERFSFPCLPGPASFTPPRSGCRFELRFLVEQRRSLAFSSGEGCIIRVWGLNVVDQLPLGRRHKVAMALVAEILFFICRETHYIAKFKHKQEFNRVQHSCQVIPITGSSVWRLRKVPSKSCGGGGVNALWVQKFELFQTPILMHYMNLFIFLRT